LKWRKASQDVETMIDRIRKSFAASEACQHGGRVRELAPEGEEPLDFSANINPLGSPPIRELLYSEIERLGHYPDNRYLEFRQAAASFLALNRENIVPGNGSSEIIRLFAETTLDYGDTAVVLSPTFGEYESQSKLFGAKVRKEEIDLDSGANLEGMNIEGAKAVYLCNPNNPTGQLFSKELVEALARRCEVQKTFLLVDEAFIELSDPEQSVAFLAPEMEYLVVMRSLTKSFGMPGLRLGFGVTNQKLAEIMNKARIPWSISSIAASAGAYLLEHGDYLEEARRLIRDEISWLNGELRRLGLKPLESKVNFILVSLGQENIQSDELADEMRSKGILIRDCQSFGLGKSYIRIAVRTREENQRLVSALKSALEA
jgi:threonine-phosphate decarboxylase